jgi:ATP-dependent Clp protease adaptor protein ClpS
MAITGAGSIDSCNWEQKKLNFYTFVKNVIEMHSGVREKQEYRVFTEEVTEDLKDLVVFNDDFNTFDHVISTLMKVCRHSPEQAEQCTWIIHYKGRCSVKKGTFEELKPMKDGIIDAGIDARIQ